MKIVLDTNVLVSGFLSPLGAPARIVGLALDGVLTLCVDPRIEYEYLEVLLRPKWNFNPADVRVVLEAIMEDAIKINAAPLNITIPDADDLMFIETAVTARADAIVTGNKKHFPQKAAGSIPVLSPAEFLEMIRKND